MDQPTAATCAVFGDYGTPLEWPNDFNAHGDFDAEDLDGLTNEIWLGTINLRFDLTAHDCKTARSLRNT
jgi:hypothetical protein